MLPWRRVPSAWEPAHLSARMEAAPNWCFQRSFAGSAARRPCRARPRAHSRSLRRRTPWPPPPPPARSSPEHDIGGDGARQRAAGAVQVARVDARRGETANAFRRHQEIDRLAAVEMAALHQHRARAEREQRRALAAISASLPRLARRAARAASARFGVRQSTSGNSSAPDRLDEARAAQRVAGGGDHDGIVDDEGRRPLREMVARSAPPPSPSGRRWPGGPDEGPEQEASRSPCPSLRERGEGFSASATAPTISGLASMPILIAATSKSSRTASICAATIAGGGSGSPARLACSAR